ncbi:MAG: cation transporter [Chitinophagales bacterium]|nr:cation transporter [Chitinophagales bacterium]
MLSTTKQMQYNLAFWLAVLTIFLAFMEAIVSTYFGYRDESLTLFGFGAGSFVEVISAIGVAHMIFRMRQKPESNRDNFESTALRITGFGFYILVAGLIASGFYNSYTGHKPETTFSGIIIAFASIIFMLSLIYGKIKVGRQLNSDAILADAECTKVCIYMSLVLLAGSSIYAWTKFTYIDTVGTFGLAYFSFKEGKECFEKAKSNKVRCDHC